MDAGTLVVFGAPFGEGTPVGAVAADLGLRVVGAPPDVVDMPPAAGLALVSVERDEDRAFKAAAALARAGARVVVQGPAKDADLILRALRAGANEFVVAGDPEALKRALHVRGATAEVRGKVIAVYGAKGGLGASTLAVNLAGAVPRNGGRACVVDLDPALGSVCALLDLATTYPITEVVTNLRRLDRELLDGSLPHHASGVAVIAPGDDVEAAERVDATTVATLLAFLRRHYDTIVVDGLDGFQERTLAALDASDKVLLVVTQEVTAVRNAQRCLEVFRKLGYAEGKVQVVLNRFQKSASIDARIVEETLEVPLAGSVANDFGALSRAIAKGALVSDEAPRAQITRDLEALLPLLGVEVPAAQRTRGILGRLFPVKAAAHGAQ